MVARQSNSPNSTFHPSTSFEFIKCVTPLSVLAKRLPGGSLTLLQRAPMSSVLKIWYKRRKAVRKKRLRITDERQPPRLPLCYIKSPGQIVGCCGDDIQLAAKACSPSSFQLPIASRRYSSRPSI